MSNMNSTANIDVKVRGIEQLQNLQNQVAKSNQAFESLKSAMLGFATAGFIGNLFKMANEITDMAAATGVGTQAILGFGKAVSANGGTMEGATNGIAKFVQKIGEAADGSKEAQDTLLKLGIGLKDLRTLSEEDLLKKAVAGFKEGTSASERLTLAVSLFGKAARSWDMAKINSELEMYIAKQKEAAAATDAAGEVSQRFSNASKTFGSQLLIALEPISKLALLITENQEAVGSFIKVIVALGSAFAVFKYVVGPLKGVQGELAAAAIEGWTFKEVLGKIGGMGGGFLKGLWDSITGLKDALFGGAKAGMAGATMLERLGLAGASIIGIFSRFAGIVSILWAVWEAVSAIAKIFFDFDLGGAISNMAKKAGQAMGFFKDETEKSGQASQKQNENVRAVTDALNKQREELLKIVSAYNEANTAANARYEQETKLLGLGELSKETYQKQLDSYGRYISEYNKLRDQFNAANASGSETDKRLVPELAAQMGALTESYKKQVSQDEALAKARVEMNRATNLSNFETKSLIESQNKLQAIQDEIAKSTMNEIEKKYYDIEAAARASAKAAIEAEEARRNEKMPIEEQKAYYDAALANTEELKKQTGEGYRQSRQWSTGWTNAFKEYADNANNAASEAKRVFDIAAQGMEDALMGFIKKGKFEWKNFVQLMVDELLRSQIRQLIGNLGSGMSSAASGIGGGLGKLLGFASGGIIPTNGPVIVGERGPELLFGAAGSQVVPNNALGGGNSIVYNISAVDAMSFKAMLAKDPTFLYAVTEQGRRSLPGGR